MKLYDSKTLYLMVFLILVITSCKKQEMVEKIRPKFEPFLSYEQATQKADSILSQLSIEEKIEMIGGHNFFFIKGLEKFNIPQLYLTDATQGVHLRENLPGQMEKTTAFPCPIALSSTWNPILANNYARSVGEECRAGGIEVLLGPGMNIYRISQNGRNFEYFGEDPYLAARMIENYVVGVQNTGTIATLKHFLANNTDYHRRNSNSVIDMRTLHEIYLPAFKAGVDAGAMAVMTSYNQINGEWAGQSEFAINELLRKQLGFKWLVMTDWWSVWDPEKSIKSGLDIEMPGHGVDGWKNMQEIGDVYVRTNAKRLLDEGKVTEQHIDRMARNVIALSLGMGLDQREQKDTTYLAKFPEHEQVALQTAREGIVLLKNEGNLLPILPTNASKILLTGQFVEKIPGGLGSAEVLGYNHVSMLSALKAEYNENIEYQVAPTNEQVSAAEYVILSIGTLDSEGWDTPFNLPDSINNLVLNYANLNSNLIVVVNTGGGLNLSPFNDKVAAILYSWYPGQNGFTALAEIISGKVNPSGKLPITIEKQFEDSPGFGYIPEGEKLYAGWDEDFDMKIPTYDINYKEGIMVGYRWYESKNIEPLYHFGHGLSYTSYQYSNIKTRVAGNSSNVAVEVEFQLKNTGKVAGAEIAQLYVSDKESSVVRPVKELKGFEKVVLNANESKTVKLLLTNEDFAFYDVETSTWKVEPGEFEILVGSASNNIQLTASVLIK